MVFGLFLTHSPEVDGHLIAFPFANAGVHIQISNLDLSAIRPRNETPPNLYIFVAPKLSVPVIIHETKIPTNTT
jgi:hypothetical protein